VSGKYSDFLPRFGRNRHRSDDKGQARFDHFIRDARLRKQQPKRRPGLKILVMVVVIGALVWGVSDRKTLFQGLKGRRSHIRTIVPLAIAMGEAPVPEHTSESIRANIAAVTPLAGACFQAWPEAQRDKEGKIEVEVTLSRDGAVEAAVFGQTGMPEAVGRCVGAALGSVKWPHPKWIRKVRFAALGGSLTQ